MGSRRAIALRATQSFALAGLMTGLVGLAPVVVVPGVAQGVAQTADQRKAEADRLNEQGIQQFQTSQFEAAFQSWQQALQLYRAIKDRRGEGAALGNLGSAYYALDNYAKAIEYQEQSLAIAREIKDRLGEGNALGNLGIAYNALGNYAKAIDYHQQRLALAREIKDRRGEGQSLGNLGNAYYALGNYAKAIDYHQQSLAIAREIKDRLGEGNALGNLGSAYNALGNYAKAIDYHQQRLALAREIKDRLGEGAALGNLGIAYYALGNYAKAIEYYEQHLAIAREIKHRQGEGNALGNLGNAYFSLGNYSKAIAYHEQSLAIARELKDRQGEGNALVNLGGAYFNLGNYAKAIEFQQQDLAIARELKNRSREGSALGNLSLAYYRLRNYDKVIEFEQQHLAIARELKDRPREGESLGQLGEASFFLGKYAKAIEFQQQSLAIAREVKNRDREGQSLDNLGDAYLSLNNYAKALEFYQQSLAIWRELRRFLAETYSLNQVGNALFKSGDLPAAAKTLMTGITTWEQLRQTEATEDATKVFIYDFQASTYQTLQEVLIAQNLPNAGLEIAERGRARAFVELLSQRLMSRLPGTAVPLPATIAPPNLQQIQQIAQAQGATLVQYSIIYDNSKLKKEENTSEAALYIWVISPTGTVTFRQADLKPLWQQQNTSLSNFVEQSRDAMGARGRSDIAVALSPERLKQQQEQQEQKLKQLHQLLIEPIADLLPKDPTQRVIFMPQGELFLVPFPALLDANNKPLLEKHTLLTAPSIQVLELTRQQRKGVGNRAWGVGKALIVGNPTMPKVVTRVGDEPVQLSDLPGAKQEALDIAKLFNTQAVTGAQATETAIAQQMPNARIIHLATHGLLDDTKGLGVPGAIALAPSGNGQLNDGLLTSDEILDMKLNAELVVLSACDTGRGRITGDGVIGLSRSLITAGVPSIVVSLWKVPDDATALLMTEFYKNLKRSPDKAQALRQAMLTTKQQHPDPLNWAAFTLIGEAE